MTWESADVGQITLQIITLHPSFNFRDIVPLLLSSDQFAWELATVFNSLVISSHPRLSDRDRQRMTALWSSSPHSEGQGLIVDLKRAQTCLLSCIQAKTTQKTCKSITSFSLSVNCIVTVFWKWYNFKICHASMLLKY